MSLNAWLPKGITLVEPTNIQQMATNKGVANLGYQGRPAREIEFYSLQIFSRKTFFFVHDLGFQMGPSVPR